MKLYIKPELTYIGKLEDLTTGGSGAKRESSGKNKRSKSNSSSRKP